MNDPEPGKTREPEERAAAASSPEREATRPIGIDEFAQVDLRVGRVVSAAPHPDADRLMVLQVDVGEETPRQLVAAIRAWWTAEELEGRIIVVVANLKPVRLRGVESQGMLLAVKGADRVIPLGVDGPVTPGTRVT